MIRGDTQTHRQQRDLISLLYFFKIRKGMLIKWRREIKRTRKMRNVEKV
jgi:hypothetical protein